MSSEPVVITLRDVYDLLVKHTDSTRDKLDELEDDLAAHTAQDAEQFADLRIKFYGLGAGMLTVLAALVFDMIKFKA